MYSNIEHIRFIGYHTSDGDDNVGEDDDENGDLTKTNLEAGS